MEKGKLIGQGATAEIFEWGDKHILKLYREGMHNSSVENEFRISQSLYEKGIPTPCAMQLVNIDGRKGIVYERINGPTMVRLITSKPWSAGKEARRLADLHYSIHNCSISGLPELKSRLRDCINFTDKLSVEKKKIIIEYINTLEDGSALCHGDFHPDNVLISGDRAVIIDWMTGMTGSQAFDVARTCLLLTIGEMPPGTSFIVKQVIQFIRKRIYTSYINRYIELSKLSMEQIEKWTLPVAAARLVEWRPQSEMDKLLRIIDEKLEKLSK